jgi:hypothetical protein
MRSPHRLYVLLAAGILGCGAGWHQPPEISPGPWPKRQQVQIWIDDHSRQWHSLVVGHDSVSGVPFTKDPDCENCRQVLALSAVDSVRVGNPVAGFWKSVGLFVAVPMAILVLICGGDNCISET